MLQHNIAKLIVQGVSVAIPRQILEINQFGLASMVNDYNSVIRSSPFDISSCNISFVISLWPLSNAETKRYLTLRYLTTLFANFF
jgi:hypothetical protein